MEKERKLHPILKKQYDAYFNSASIDPALLPFLELVNDTYEQLFLSVKNNNHHDQVLDAAPREIDADMEKRNKDLEKMKTALMNVLEDAYVLQKKIESQVDDLQKFRLASDYSFDHIIITDIEGKIVYANRAAEMLTGYSVDEMLGKTPRLWGGQMGKEFYERMWRVIKIEKERFASEINNRKKDGTPYLAESRITPIFDEKGEVKFFVGVERDITGRRQSELKLLDHAKEMEEAKMNLELEKKKTDSILRFLKSIGDGVFATDLSGNIIFMNRMAEVLSEQSFDVAQGKHYNEIFGFKFERDDSEEYPGFVEMVLETGLRQQVLEHTILVGKNGLRTMIANAASPIIDDAGDLVGCVVVLQDVTRERELEKMKDGFLSVAAHQLRTPLGSMRWNMEMLLSGDVGDLGEQPKEVVQSIYESSQRLVLLVNDLLNVSRLDQGKAQEDPAVVDIVAAIEESIKTLSNDAKKRGVNVSIAFEGDDRSYKAMIAPKRFFESIQNLLSNALKYNNKDGEVVFGFKKMGDVMQITIKDTGIGIPKEEQSKVFGKFFRAKNAVLNETEGTGLGLFVVKSFIEESGGKVWFESEEEKGTTFFIELPLNA